MSTPLRKKRGNALIWTLMGLLVLGLGGFGITSFGGSTRAIARVGEREISVRDYAIALRGEMDAMSEQLGQPVNIQIAQTLGVDRQVQQRLFTTAALDNEVARLGISVGDDEVGRRLTEITAFRGPDGAFDRETYRFFLERQGLTEAEFETRLREDMARGLVEVAVATGVTTPDVFVDTLIAYVGERRDFTVAELLASDLAEPVPEPTEDQIKAYYDANPEPFTQPETRVISYLWLTPEKVAETVQLDEAALKAAYDARKGEYVIPERRLVERVVFESDEAAAAARARIDAGEATLADIAIERGLEAADIDLGEVSRDDLGATADAVFALTEPGIVGPIASDLGPALLSMNGILAAEETPFDEVRDDLEAEARMDRARRMILDQSPDIEDQLATGANLEDVAKATGTEFGTIEFNTEAEGGLAGYPEFRDAATKATTDDFPALVALEDGGIFAIRLDRIDPPALRPLDEVRDRVIAGWRRAETRERLLALTDEHKAALDNGATLATLGLVTTAFDDLSRGGFIADAPPEVRETAFSVEAGQSAVVDSSGRVFLVSVEAVRPVDPEDEEIAALRTQFTTQTGQAIAQDLYQYFAFEIEKGAGLTIDQAAINAVHAQLN